MVVDRVRQLTGCISVAVYLSPALNRTLAQICFDASLPGFKRDFFAHGQKRKGANLLIKCEVPVPWSKSLSYDRKKQLSDFFEGCPDLQTIGDDGDATFSYREWQDTKHERMRDKKSRYKREQQMLSKEELAKADRAIMGKMVNEYIMTCKRFPVDPNEFVKSQDEQYGDKHYLAGVKLYASLERHYETSLKLHRKKPLWELPRDTLGQYCETHSVSVSPIACARRISRARHGRALRSIWRLIIEKKRGKVHVGWLYGVASSGKSMLVRRVRQVFAGDEVDWRGQYLPVRK